MTQTTGRAEMKESGKFTTPMGVVNAKDEEMYDKERFAQFKKMSVDGLVLEGARLCELYGRATPHLKALAEVIVALRFKHRDPTQKNVPDWGGNSSGYSRAVERIYEQAGVGDRKSSIRNALRYHVQNLVKEVAPPAQLEKLKIKKEKRGAGGSTTTTTGTTATTTAKNVKATKVNPLEYFNDAQELINLTLKALSSGKEATQKGITDDDLRIQVIKVSDSVAKTAQQVMELATLLSSRHQGRTTEVKKEASPATKSVS